MNEFKVNKYLSLRLEDGKTYIYVEGQRFQQCKFLLLNIPIDKIVLFEDMKSIDETIEKLDKSLEGNSLKKFEISPETEFWGHSSNIQVWYEHNYDTRLLHKNLAFPLLKKLVDVGDPIAANVFKEEIVKRFSTPNLAVAVYLLEECYIDYLHKEEKELIFLDINKNLRKSIKNSFSNEYYSRYFIFPILNQLINLGDYYALKILSERITYLIEEDDSSTLIYLNQKGLLKNLKEYNYNLWYKYVSYISDIDSILRDFRVRTGKIFFIVKKIDVSTHMGYVLKDNLITGLGLFESGLTSVPESIKDLKSLEVLNIGGNNLTGLHEAIGYLPILHTLYLNKNLLRSLPLSLSNLHSLKNLDLSNNKLRSIPEVLFSLKELEKLYLNGNLLDNIPNSIILLNSIKTLDLSDNPLSSFPKAILGIISLRSLNLNRAKLTKISKLISNLNMLECLSLTSNNLSGLPASIGNLTSLKRINLDFNNISRLPDSIGNLNRLEIINLNNNQLQYLPDSIGNLKNLANLLIRSNKLIEIPKTIENLKNIIELDIGSNNLKFLPEEIKSLDTLKNLYLDYNELNVFPHSITNLKSLEYLSINNNKIDNLPNSILELDLLKGVDLSNNPLTYISDSLLLKLKNKGVNIKRI